MITWPVYSGRASYPTTCKIQFWYIGPMEGSVLHSIAFSDASRCGGQKKDDEIQLTGSWVGVLFQKILATGHNTGQVIIKDERCQSNLTSFLTSY